MSTALTRRGLLRGASGAAAVLLVGADLAGCAARATAPTVQFKPSAWVRVDSAGQVLVTISQAEMGQGIATGLSQVVADELGAAWEQVTFEFATGAPEFIHPTLYKGEQITGGSRSMAAFWLPMRTAAAATREMLVSAAAARWGVAVQECSARDGAVVHAATRRALPFADLVEAAAALPVPAKPVLKPASAYTLVGKPVRRLDAKAKATGEAVYGIDVIRPGMLYAAVRHAPVCGSTVESVDDSRSRSMPGVRAVLKLPEAVAVVADHYWQAVQALEQTGATFSRTPADAVGSEQLYAAQRDALGAAKGASAPAAIGDAGKALAQATRTFEADYQLPFLAHACMEPMSATAEVTADGAQLWLSTQAPTWDASFAAEALGIPVGKVKVHPTYMGGAFGRRAGREHVSEAVLCARATGRPVKVIWSREEDIRTDQLRPAQAARMRAALDADGRVTALQMRGASHNYFSYARPHLVQNGLDFMGVIGLFDAPYKLDHRSMDYVATPNHLRIGAWRGTSNSHNTFFLEAFINELAGHAGQDAWQYRRALLAHDPRSLAVLDRAAQAARWKSRPDRFYGLAFMQANRWGTRVAEVVEIGRADQGALRIENVTVVADSGLVINPKLVEQNLGGGVIFGLSAAMQGEITIDKGAVEQGNYHDYPVLRLPQVPPIQVITIEGDDKPASFGEVSLPPVAPALVAAVAQATGKAIRSLPLSKAGIWFAA